MIGCAMYELVGDSSGIVEDSMLIATIVPCWPRPTCWRGHSYRSR
jgi:hypothetical protein